MSAAEVQLLVDDLREELVFAGNAPDAQMRVAAFDRLMDSFVLDWRQLCALHGLDGRGRPEFQRLAAAVGDAAQRLADGIVPLGLALTATGALVEGLGGGTRRRLGWIAVAAILAVDLPSESRHWPLPARS